MKVIKQTFWDKREKNIKRFHDSYIIPCALFTSYSNVKYRKYKRLAMLILECLEIVRSIQIAFIISDYISNITIVMNYRWMILQEYIFLYACACMVCVYAYQNVDGWTCLYIESWCWLFESFFTSFYLINWNKNTQLNPDLTDDC